MANEIIKSERPVFTPEQKEAWNKAKLLLKSLVHGNKVRYRALHIAMSELRGKYKLKQGPIEIESKDPNKAHQRRMEDIAINLRGRVDAWKEYLTNPGAKKLFVFTDPDLSDSQKAVQSAHAVAQFQKEHPLAPWVNGTLVLLTPDRDLRPFNRLAKEDSLMNHFVSWYAHSYYAEYITVWTESDMDDAITSVVMLDDFKEVGKISGTKML